MTEAVVIKQPTVAFNFELFSAAYKLSHKNTAA